jgi:hypothetical protein
MKNKGFVIQSVSGVTEKRAKHRQFSGHSYLVGRDQNRSRKEGSMTSKCVTGVLIVVLGLAFASPAQAQMGKIIESIGYDDSIWFQIAWAAAALLVLAIIVIHELSVIVTLCPFAALRTEATTNFGMTCGTPAENLERSH